MNVVVRRIIMATTNEANQSKANTCSEIMTILIDELRQSLEPKVATMLADYQLYKETHDAVSQIPFVKSLMERQQMCMCQQPQGNRTRNQQQPQECVEPIQLEIIDHSPAQVPNLDSIFEYVHSQDNDDKSKEQETDQEEEEQAEEEQAEEAEEEEEQAEEAEEEAEEAEEEEEAEEDQEEEELELFEVEIKGKTYVTNDETNGDIYEYNNDEVGEIVGAFKNGVAKMLKKSKSQK